EVEDGDVAAAWHGAVTGVSHRRGDGLGHEAGRDDIGQCGGAFEFSKACAAPCGGVTQSHHRRRIVSERYGLFVDVTKNGRDEIDNSERVVTANDWRRLTDVPLQFANRVLRPHAS